MPPRPFRRLAPPLLVALVLFGCAPKQRIVLDCLPREVVIYVDGERIDEMPSALDLRSDQPHTLYFKGVDFAPELVVLNVEDVDGKRRLSPERVCVTPRYFEVRRELEIAIDPDVAAGPPSDGEESRTAVDVEPRPDFIPSGP